MESEPLKTASRSLLRVSMGVGLIAAVSAAWPQPKPGTGAGPGIYRCEVNGKRLTSDRLIPECADRQQTLLNADGSVRKIIPPSQTADERAEAEQKEREAQAERVARQDAVRRDRNLVNRFPNEVAHRKAREAALDDVRNAVRISETRVKILQQERKKLDEEAEFYPGKQLPAKLRSALDANDAALDAQRALIQNQQAELVRINALYDSELERLKKLWSGVPVGSLAAASTPVAGAAPAAKTR